MSIPTDRGFVLVRDDEDRTHQVEIYSKRPSAGDIPYASYSRIPRIFTKSVTSFARFDGGELSDQVLEVVWSEVDNAVYLCDEAPFPA